MSIQAGPTKCILANVFKPVISAHSRWYTLLPSVHLSRKQDRPGEEGLAERHEQLFDEVGDQIVQHWRICQMLLLRSSTASPKSTILSKSSNLFDERSYQYFRSTVTHPQSYVKDSNILAVVVQSCVCVKSWIVQHYIYCGVSLRLKFCAFYKLLKITRTP